MLQFWSIWNFTWWTSSELGYCPMNGPLKASILFTSAIGGYLTHVYPKKIKINTGSFKYTIPYKYCIIIDILTHQLPLYRMLTNKKKSSTDKCATYVIIPVTLYTFVNYFRGINMHKIYGVNMYKIYASSIGITGMYGALHHYIL